ncbi:hypothetical protein ACFP81_06145 [Deinococcus lacus]|uniref:DUF11 domain-containing protein n=1 Tax=Deinococcus lacus TaxID=392561 RepID=A0ABW1YCD7_9DEIO
MNTKYPLVFTAAALLGLGSSVAQAPAPSPLQLTLSQFQVQSVTVAGKVTEKLVASDQSAPGQIVQYGLAAKNVGNTELRNVKVVLPVQPGTTFVSSAGGLLGIRTEFSIDGGKNFAPAPLKRKVTVIEGGKSVTREVAVKPSEYQAVRWNIGALKPGETKNFVLRVKVQSP